MAPKLPMPQIEPALGVPLAADKASPLVSKINNVDQLRVREIHKGERGKGGGD